MKQQNIIALALAAVLLSLAVVTGGAGEPKAKPGLAEIPRRMQEFVADGTIAGSVTLVAQRGQVLSLEAVGYADIVAKRKMTIDHLFWIASMTKPMTAVAVLMLQDEGKLSVEDPVEKYLPEFKNQWLISRQTGQTMELVKPARPITLRDLLTHTSGLGDVAAPRVDCSLAEMVMAYAQQPLRFPPGSKWEYSNAGINTLGRIAEVVSGTPYAEFLQKRLFGPLGMFDTTFWPSGEQLRRLAKTYQPAKGGGIEETGIFFTRGALNDRQRTAYPAGGLFSTAQDIGRFFQMMLNGGTQYGQRYLTKETVAAMTRTQTGEIKTGFVDGMSFGFGFAVVKEPLGVTAMLSQGAFGHGGAYATQSWADPKKDLILVMMIQRAGFPNGDNSLVRKAFQETAVKSILE